MTPKPRSSGPLARLRSPRPLNVTVRRTRGDYPLQDESGPPIPVGRYGRLCRNPARWSITMTDMMVSTLAALIGAMVLICRRRLARLVVETQNHVWGFTFGSREERLSRFVIVTVGAAFLIVGALALIGVIHWKPRSQVGLLSHAAPAVRMNGRGHR